MKKTKLSTKIVIILAGLLILSAIFSALTPKEEPIPATQKFTSKNKNQTISNYSNIIFSGEKPDLPQELTISAVEETTDEETIISNILTNYNLNPNKQIKQFWTGPNNQALHQDIYSKKYKLSLNPNSNLVTDSFNLEKTLITIQKELNSLFPESNLNPQQNKITYFKEAVEFYQKSDQSNFDFAQIPFSYTVEGFSLKYKKDDEDPFIINVNKLGSITSISFSPLFITTTPAGTKERISITQALENINQKNLGSIISYDLITDSHKTDLSQIKSADLAQVELEYRYDEAVGLAYPFYHFSGLGIDATDQKITLEIITPAIETTPVD